MHVAAGAPREGLLLRLLVCLTRKISRQIVAEGAQEAPVTFRRDGPDRTDDPAARKNSQKSESNEGLVYKTAGSEVGVVSRHQLVKPDDSLLQPRADATDQEVLVRRHLTQNNLRPILDDSIGLRDGSQHDVTFPHIQD